MKLEKLGFKETGFTSPGQVMPENFVEFGHLSPQ
jgi:hypothetical protein